jgi:hypothetical protein
VIVRFASLVLAGALVAGCAGQPAPSGSTSESPRNPAIYIEGTPYQPAFDPSDFVQGIDNPYLLFRPGTTLIYQGVSDGERERVEVTTTSETKEILGITAIVVRDQVFVEGELTEDTFDWYAQDQAGNVWYLGEDTKEYEKGKVVSTEGSWEAGVDGAQPGIVMLGDPRPGDTYRQEYYRGEAEDVGRVVALDESVTVPQGAFDEVLVTEDWTPLEPKLLENKFYARGVGVVFERLVKGGEEVLRLVEIEQA